MAQIGVLGETSVFSLAPKPAVLIFFLAQKLGRVYSNYKSEPATQPTNNVPAATLKPSMYREPSLS